MKRIIKYFVWIIINIITGFISLYAFLQYDNRLSDGLLIWLQLYPLIGGILTIIVLSKIIKDNRKYKSRNSVILISLYFLSLFLVPVFSPRNDMGSITTTYTITDKAFENNKYKVKVFDKYFNKELAFLVVEDVYDTIEIDSDIAYTLSYRYAKLGDTVYTKLKTFHLDPVDNTRK